MINKLIDWAVHSTLIVILITIAMAGFGTYAFLHVNVEAYPDPAPAIVEVIAQWPGASAEEIERQVTIPLEVALAGIPGLKYSRTKSLFGLSHLRNQFEYGPSYEWAKQQVINRLQLVQGLPPGVVAQISPESPTGEIYRYTLSNPCDSQGREIGVYTLNDIKALQDWTLERIFRRVPRIADVSSSGGTVKRYEIHPDPDQLRKYGLTLQQLQTAISNSNANGGGDVLVQGHSAMNVRGVGLIGGGRDPSQTVLTIEGAEMDTLLTADPILTADQKQRIKNFLRTGVANPPLTADEQRALRTLRQQSRLSAALKAVPLLRAEDERRVREIRQVVITSINNVPIRVENVVEGGPIRSSDQQLGAQGVVVNYQTRLGRVGMSRPMHDVHGHEVLDANGEVVWLDEDDKIQGIILLRKGEDSLPALADVEAKVRELNETPGRMLPGMQIVPYYDRTDLIGITTETVRENLFFGMILVTIILLMFLSNVRSALIVAINIPLALLFAFSVLYLRGKSANLLSIGAVDFGIIVDSSVIMVENIYRHISAGEHPELPLRQRILKATKEVQGCLFFSTAIMVCAFIPLFTMQGPEGQIFGPMADTYAFALGGALLLALTVAPVLCVLFFRNLKPADDNIMVRWLKSSYLRQLERCLNYRWVSLGAFATVIVITLMTLPLLGREFMPELEEGNLWIRGTFPLEISLERAAQNTRVARGIMRQYGEVESIVTQIGRPDDGTDPTGFYNVECFVPLKPESHWPKVVPVEGWRSWFGGKRRRTKQELIAAMSDELNRKILGVDWNFSQNIRDNVMEALSGVKGDNSVKIFGPDLDELERVADQVKIRLEKVYGLRSVAVFHVMGQTNLEFGINREKCNQWGISVGDVQNVIRSAVGGQAFTQMVEGERTFDITLRWPARLRSDEESILDIPVDVSNNTVTPGSVAGAAPTLITGATTGISMIGTSASLPAIPGSQFAGTLNNISSTPRIRLRELVTPLDENGLPDPKGQFNRPGASTIYREQGYRLIAIKFSVDNTKRDLAGAVAEAQQVTADLIRAPYRAEWSGEFQEMEEAEQRLMFIIPLSLVLIFALLYLAFGSLLDVVTVLSNVVALSLGGIWALLLTNTNFSISAAVGFISIFGVAIMDGLLLISYFNTLRCQGLPLREAIMEGSAKRVRPVMMTALTAVFGLLPAALSTRIGSQTQQPLAIVVVGGMLATLLLTRYLMPVLYSFYGHREPVHSASGLVH